MLVELDGRGRRTGRRAKMIKMAGHSQITMLDSSSDIKPGFKHGANKKSTSQFANDFRE